MQYKTARWLTILLSIIAAFAITTYFYLDSKDRMLTYLAIIIKPLMMVTLFPAVFLLLASIMASTKKEDRISRQNFQNAFIILICLIGFRVIGTLL